MYVRRQKELMEVGRLHGWQMVGGYAGRVAMRDARKLIRGPGMLAKGWYSY